MISPFTNAALFLWGVRTPLPECKRKMPLRHRVSPGGALLYPRQGSRVFPQTERFTENRGQVSNHSISAVRCKRKNLTSNNVHEKQTVGREGNGVNRRPVIWAVCREDQLYDRARLWATGRDRFWKGLLPSPLRLCFETAWRFGMSPCQTGSIRFILNSDFKTFNS